MITSESQAIEMHSLTEEHLEEICARCSAPAHEEWDEEWSKNTHYKRRVCSECGYVSRKRSSEFKSSMHH